MIQNILWILGDWFADRAPSEIFLVAFVAGSVLSWFAAREWFRGSEDEQQDMVD